MPLTTSGLTLEMIREQVLRAFRSVMPGVAGVVLSTPEGQVLAHEDLAAHSPEELAREAVSQWKGDGAAGASTLIERGSRLFLIVFVPAQLAAAWAAMVASPPAAPAAP